MNSQSQSQETDRIEPTEMECEPVRGPRWARWLKRIAIAFGVVIVALVVLGFMLYNFGGMWLPRPELKAQYAQLVANGTQPAVQGRFTIPIPGCVCHSNDPVLTMQHTTRHINECSQCHNRVGPQ